jgi:hypothetical protein
LSLRSRSGCSRIFRAMSDTGVRRFGGRCRGWRSPVCSRRSRSRAFLGAAATCRRYGLKTGGQPTQPIELPGVLLAAVATLGLGLVLGPEAPLIALGMGLGFLAVRQLKKDAPDQAVALMAAAGSFAAGLLAAHLPGYGETQALPC